MSKFRTHVITLGVFLVAAGVASAMIWRGGHEPPPLSALKIALGLFLSLLPACLAKMLIELKIYKQSLEALVEQRSAELARISRDMADLNGARHKELAENKIIAETLRQKTSELAEEIELRRATGRRMDEQTALLEEEKAKRATIQEEFSRLCQFMAAPAGNTAGGCNARDAFLCGSETILLAEDDEMVMEITASSLTEHGYKVFQAVNGADAVELFAAHRDEIDLVILDAIMPKMTGKQAWNEIREMRPAVKACFVSGYTNEINSGKLAIDFSIPFIGKPVLPEIMLRKVREILDNG
jgi:CheY-like chemotaxis protein